MGEDCQQHIRKETDDNIQQHKALYKFCIFNMFI